jgi:DNA-binding LytR/AlgR family response regulator
MITAKILIVEDEVLIAEHIKQYLISFGYSQIFLAHNKKLALNAIDNIKPDLVLLDLHLQHSSDGLDIAKTIDESCKTPYIYITANTDIIIVQKAILTKAAAYITKPLKKSDLFAAVQIALKQSNDIELPFLVIKENNFSIKIAFNDILFIESNGNYINIHTINSKQIVRHSLEWIEEHLPSQQFMRIHRSFLVNIRFILRTNSKVVFVDTHELPVSRTYLPKLLDYLNHK